MGAERPSPRPPSQRDGGSDPASAAEAFAEAKELALGAGVTGAADKSCLGELLALCFEELCEQDLVQPTFVLDHPTEVGVRPKDRIIDDTAAPSIQPTLARCTLLREL